MKRAAVIGALLLSAAIAVLVFRAPAARTGDGLERVRVARGTVGTTVKATGIVKPMVGAEVRVGSRASGVVERLFVRVGDAVEAGQVLARLDTRELEARVVEEWAARVGAEHGFTDIEHVVDLFGVCERCRAGDRV